jgi:hypothetical protein
MLVKIGQVTRLLDENGQVSLTNLSIMISLYKLLVVPNASFMEVGTFLISALAYNYKRGVNLSTSAAAVAIAPPNN